MNPEDMSQKQENEIEHSFEDRWLEETLSRYSAAEPRVGLETRILANLQAHAAQRRRRWIYAFAAASAVLLFAAAIAGLRNSKDRPPVSVATQASQPTMKPAGPAATGAKQPRKSGIQLVHRRGGAVQRVKKLQLATDVKQECFPAERPLTEQERLLQTYLRQTPKEELELVMVRQKEMEADLEEAVRRSEERTSQ